MLEEDDRAGAIVWSREQGGERQGGERERGRGKGQREGGGGKERTIRKRESSLKLI